MSKTKTNEILPAIVIECDGNEYTLDFDNESVKKLEGMGYDPANFATLTNVEILVKGAFLANHPTFNARKKAMELYYAIDEDERGDFISALYSLYVQAVDRAMFKQKNEKNASWRRAE